MAKSYIRYFIFLCIFLAGAAGLKAANAYRHGIVNISKADHASGGRDQLYHISRVSQFITGSSVPGTKGRDGSFIAEENEVEEKESLPLLKQLSGNNFFTVYSLAANFLSESFKAVPALAEHLPGTSARFYLLFLVFRI